MWHELKEERGFERIPHCKIASESVAKDIAELKEKKLIWADSSTDYFGNKIHRTSNVLEFPSQQFKTLAKHLEISTCSRSSFSKAIRGILADIFELLKSGKVHPNLVVRKLGRDDPCYDKHKCKQSQYGCFAQNQIEAGSVLAEYVGEWKQDTGMKLRSRKCEQDDATLSKDSLEEDSQDLHAEDYAFSTGHESDRSADLFIDSKQWGNESAFINDGGETMPINARYVRVLVNGVYVIICIAMKKIEIGEQVLTKYGKSYWAARSEHQRLRAIVAGEPIDEQSSAVEQLRPRRKKPTGYYREAGLRDLLPSAIEVIALCSRQFVCPFVFNLDRLSGFCVHATTDIISLPIFLGEVQPAIPRSDSGLVQEPKSGSSSESSDDLGEEDSINQKALQRPEFRRRKRSSNSGGNEREVKPRKAACGLPSEMLDSQRASATGLELGQASTVSNADGEEENVMEALICRIKLDTRLSGAAGIDDCVRQLQELLKEAWRQELAVGSCAKAQSVDALRRCSERLRKPERVSVALVGQTGVGKSFLANLFALVSAPQDKVYGANLYLSPSRLSQLRERVKSRQPWARSMLVGLFLELEGLEDLCGVLGMEARVLAEDLAKRGNSEKACSCVDVRCFEPPTNEELETDRAEMCELLSTCLKVSAR